MGLIGTLGAMPAGSTESWTCRNGGLVRQITVFYPDAPARLPCKVFYSKPTENRMPSALWRSQHQAGYCERQASAFAARLGTLGWQCAADEAAGN